MNEHRDKRERTYRDAGDEHRHEKEQVKRLGGGT